MGAQHRTVQMDKLAGLRPALRDVLYHLGIIPVRHETDVLAVRLLGVLQPFRCRFLPNLRLAQMPQRKQNMRQLFLFQGVQHITLVLLPVFSPQQQPASAFFLKFYIGIVSGRDIIAAQLLRPGKQLPQLHVFVAVHAGVGRPSVFIFRNETVDDVRTKIFTEIKHMMGKAQFGRRLCGIRHIGKAAVVLRSQPDLFRVEHLQRYADDIIACLLQQQRRRRAVYAAAHGH